MANETWLTSFNPGYAGMTNKNSEYPMRVASILCENAESAKIKISEVLPFADVIELRLDSFKKLDLLTIQKLRHAISLPVIFTLRKKSQGGFCELPEVERLVLIQQLAKFEPDYFDLEFDTPIEFIQSLKSSHSNIQIIGSYHDFVQTPDNLEQLLASLDQPYFDIFKIATFANNLCDTLRLLLLLKKVSSTRPIIGMAMGEYGQTSRILAPIVGSLMTYGSVDEASATAPGQITLQEMTEVYRVHLLNNHTKIHALLGYPIVQSSGHLFHNQAFAQKNRNAVYVRLKTAPEYLGEAIALLKQLPFANFSVTMPHKETVMSYLDDIEAAATAMGAVNTIKVQQGKYIGFNTDGPASVDVLAEKVDLTNAKILILGAGGAAKAIAYALSAQGARITICNRTLERAQTLAQKCAGDTVNFSQLLALKQISYDVIINTLPAAAFAEQCAHWEMPKIGPLPPIAMEIVQKPAQTLFLQQAQQAGYICISGDALYKAQALRQSKIWFD
jgi:3-dehydroquinate dehydratase/shikimate dehydrogenase